MTKKQCILKLCKKIGIPVKQYCSGGGYTYLYLKNGSCLNVYCDKSGSSRTYSLKLKFRAGTVGQVEVDKAKRWLQHYVYYCKVDTYISNPDRIGCRQSVLRIRTEDYPLWKYIHELY